MSRGPGALEAGRTEMVGSEGHGSCPLCVLSSSEPDHTGGAGVGGFFSALVSSPGGKKARTPGSSVISPVAGLRELLGSACTGGKGS